MESEIEILDDGHFGKSGRKFIVYFLFDDEDQKVHVEEIKEIDLPRITKHLNSGGSVFIAGREEHPESSDSKRNEIAADIEVMPISSYEIVNVF
ncbi:MAG: hypothetical protein ACETV1_06520 [Candidatus Bathyarchaeia archaeon]